MIKKKNLNDSLCIPNATVYVCNKCGHRNLTFNSREIRNSSKHPSCENCQRDKNLDQARNARYVRFVQKENPKRFVMDDLFSFF